MGLGAGDRGREEVRKEAITLEWPLNIQFVSQTRAKFHLRTAPRVIASGPPHARKQLCYGPGTFTPCAITFKPCWEAKVGE